jgi:hypothetical protein
MTAVYASTSPDWFHFLSARGANQAAFWRPTPRRPGRITPGEPWFFKEWGAPYLLGFGRFVAYENTTPRQLFETHGDTCGSASLDALLAALRQVRAGFQADDAIGNVVLSDFTAFDAPVAVADVGLADLSVPFAYVPPGSPTLDLVGVAPAAVMPLDAAEQEAAAHLPPARREYLRELTVRNRQHVVTLKRLYEGRCQISGRVVLEGIAGDLTEAHHIQWLTRDGIDDPSNMVVVSPEFHAAIHAADATFDWTTLSFTVNGRVFPLQLNRHLVRRPT